MTDILIDAKWNYSGTIILPRLSSDQLEMLNEVLKNIGDRAYNQGYKNGCKDALASVWHHKPLEGWTDESMPEVGKDIVVCCIYHVLITYTDYYSGRLSEYGKLIDYDSNIIADFNEVSMWMYIPEEQQDEKM